MVIIFCLSALEVEAKWPCCQPDLLWMAPWRASGGSWVCLCWFCVHVIISGRLRDVLFFFILIFFPRQFAAFLLLHVSLSASELYCYTFYFLVNYKHTEINEKFAVMAFFFYHNITTPSLPLFLPLTPYLGRPDPLSPRQCPQSLNGTSSTSTPAQWTSWVWWASQPSSAWRSQHWTPKESRFSISSSLSPMLPWSSPPGLSGGSIALSFL